MPVNSIQNRIDGMIREALERRAGEYEFVEYHSTVVALPALAEGGFGFNIEVVVFLVLRRDEEEATVVNTHFPIEVCYDLDKFRAYMDYLWDELMVSTINPDFVLPDDPH